MKYTPEGLKAQMISEAMLILDSVSFLEKQVHIKLMEIDEAKNNNLEDDAPRLESEIKALLVRINLENKNMDIFMKKYKKEIKNEKKAILPNPKQKK
jgi:hypothetical protein